MPLIPFIEEISLRRIEKLSSSKLLLMQINISIGTGIAIYINYKTSYNSYFE
jgi:hypothetical protein